MSTEVARPGNGSTAVSFPASALSQLIRGRIDKATEDDPDVMLVEGDPDWEVQPHESVGGRRVELRTAQSPLAVWDLLAEHADLEGDEFLVIVTDLGDTALGPEILGQVINSKIYDLEPWEAVQEAFGASQIEPRLRKESWAADALLDVARYGGSTMVGPVLSHDDALALLVLRRLSVPGFEVGRDGIDIRTLLSWSQRPGALERFAALRTVEREKLALWLADRVGAPARALFALIAAERGADAVALGLVCSALWRDAPSEVQLAEPRVRAKLFFTSDPLARPSFGGESLRDEDFLAFGVAAADYFASLGSVNGNETPETVAAEQNRLLNRAAHLVTQTGAEDAAAYSTLLTSGLDARYAVVARALDAAVPTGRRAGAGPSPAALDEVRQAVEAFARHRLAAHHPVDTDHMRMALRLVRWLATPEPEAATVAAAVQTQIEDGGWVDRALYRISNGTDKSVPALGDALAKLGRAVAARRKARDEQFAAMLAVWTSSGSEPGSLLTVESFARRVLEPLKKSQPGFLFLLVDALSAAAAADLGADLRRSGVWTEYDPLAGSAPFGRRRGMAAALPTVTGVSRTSLFAADLVDGDQNTEIQRFPGLPLWGAAKVQLFHKADLRADVGSRLGGRLQEAMDDTATHVAVVLNTVDDLLDDSHERAKPWTVDAIDKMRMLLDQAASAGRPVVIASDHGHMLDLGTESVPAGIAGSGRHRVDAAPAGRGEVELTGPRVVVPGRRIVALWDTDLRYGNRKTGYHGGVSLAEFVIPVLALLPQGVPVPKGWVPVARTEPVWSNLEFADPAFAPPAEPLAERVPVKRPKHVSEHQEQLLDLVEPTPATLVEQVLATELFKQRRLALPRPQSMPASKIAKALAALVDAGGVLPAVAAAHAAGELPTRARGFATNLRRVLNVDGEPVLSELDQRATLRLDTAKLRTQFLSGNPD